MKPHHCKFCGKLISTERERTMHLAERRQRIGCDAALVPADAPESERAYLKKREELGRVSLDRKKMEERQGLGPKETNLTLKLREWQEKQKQRKAG
jgi:hypothetical protein